MGKHRLHVAAQGLDAGGGHLVAQELDGGGGENLLLCVNHQAGLAQPRENYSQMLQVFLLVPAGYNDVIQVAEDEGEARQDAVHHPLEGVARIAQPGCEAGAGSVTCTCDAAGRPTGVAAAIAEVSAGSGWLRTLETVGRSWVETVSTRRFAAGST
jgi:hypothetical protein